MDKKEKVNVKEKQREIRTHIFLAAFGLFMVFPLIWMAFGTFKSNKELFSSAKLLPEHFTLQYFIEGWNAQGQYTYGTFLVNTIVLVIPVVIFTVISCSLVAYGFSRFRFPMKKMLFMLMISTMMLPNTVIIIPRYIIFRELGWLNSYMPFYMPALLACYPFYIFMLIQFLRGIPRELDEAAYIDGCSSFTVFVRILLPILKPALFSAGLLQLMSTWNDFFNSLIYINSLSKYTLSLALRMTIDAGAQIGWASILAMALVAMGPLVSLFFSAQKYFVEGIATSGLKG